MTGLAGIRSLAAAVSVCALIVGAAGCSGRASAAQDAGTVVSGPASLVEQAERGGSKIFRWSPFTLTNSHGDSASAVTNFTVTLISEPGQPPRTMAVVNYDIYAYSQNDKGGGVTFSIELLDQGGNVILRDAVEGQFMRDHCTYGGPEHYTLGPTVVPRNFFDSVESARLRWRYSSHYEGRC